MSDSDALLETKHAPPEDDWLIDDSTKQLYLSLLPADKKGTRDRKAAKAEPPKLPVAGQERDGHSSAVEAQQNAEARVGLSDGWESPSRFLAYCALFLVLSFMLYRVIADCGSSTTASSAAHRTQIANQDVDRAMPVPNAPANLQVASSSLLPAYPLTGAASLTTAPALILLPDNPGQTTTQTLVVNNSTIYEFTFELEGKDLIVREGKAVFLPAGELTDSIASNLLFSKKSVNVKAGQSASFDVTLTVPRQTLVRGVLIVLK
jgi:hypothetical protein